MSATAPQEEEALGKAYDARLVRRLATLVRPYRRYALGSVLVLLVESFLQLSGPLLTICSRSNRCCR